jgi:Mg2+-importing ATPase
LFIVAAAVLLPLTPLAIYLGFVAPPPSFFLLLAGMVLVYLFAAEGVRYLFYRYLAGSKTSIRTL